MATTAAAAASLKLTGTVLGQGRLHAGITCMAAIVTKKYALLCHALRSEYTVVLTTVNNAAATLSFVEHDTATPILCSIRCCTQLLSTKK